METTARIDRSALGSGRLSSRAGFTMKNALFKQLIVLLPGSPAGPGGCSQYFQSMYLGPLALGVVGR